MPTETPFAFRIPHFALSLVLVQFATAITILFPVPVASTWAGLIAQILALGLGVWAILAMRLPNVSILPDVKRDAVLVTRGPYRVIRHPMYTTVLLYTLVQCIDRDGVTNWCVWGVLLIDLLIKLRYEEGKMCARFPEYAAYMQRTTRFIPWVV